MKILYQNHIDIKVGKKRLNLDVEIDRETKRGIMKEIKNRDMYTLMSEIGKHIRV